MHFHKNNFIPYIHAKQSSISEREIDRSDKYTNSNRVVAYQRERNRQFRYIHKFKVQMHL